MSPSRCVSGRWGARSFAIALAALVVLLVGCASKGPSYAELRDELPALQLDLARIVYFNPRGIRLAGSESFSVDDRTRGIASLGGARDGTFGFVDVGPGEHILGVPNGWLGRFRRRVKLDAGQHLYVLVSQYRMSFVPEAEALRVLEPCRLKPVEQHRIEAPGVPADAVPFANDSRSLGAAPLPDGLDRPAEGKGRVVWLFPHRSPAWADGTVIRHRVLIDEVERGSVRPGEYGFADFDPGFHIMHTRNFFTGPAENGGGHNPRLVEVVEGRTTYVEVTLGTEPALIEVTPASAALALRGASYRDADPGAESD